MNRLTKIIDGSVVLIGSPSIIDLAEKLAFYEKLTEENDLISRKGLQEKMQDIRIHDVEAAKIWIDSESIIDNAETIAYKK